MAVKIEHHREMGDYQYGASEQLTPLIRRVLCKNPTPFTYKGTATFIVGHGDVAVVDPGPPLDSHIDDIEAALAPDDQVSAILITHTHSDHSPGAVALKERTGATIYGYGPHGEVRPHDPNDRVDFSKYFTSDEKKKFDKEWDDLPDELKREGPDLDFAPDEKVTDGDIVRGGGWTFEAVHTPGHCSNHICWGLAEEQSLLTGDHVMGWATSVVGPPDGSMADYLASLRKLLDRDDVRYHPTHGPEIPNPQAYVSSFLAHREEREDQIRSYLRDGAKQIADFIPEMYAAYDKRLWYPAAGSVFAHILHLVETEQVAMTDSETPKLTSTYRLAG